MQQVLKHRIHPAPQPVHPSVITAASFIRKLRGDSQAMLVEGTDRCLYAVKLSGNQNACGSIASEFIGAILCQALRFPVPRSHLVEISDSFLNRYSDAWFQTPNGSTRPSAGLHFGTSFACANEGDGRPFELFGDSWKPKIRNQGHFWGMYLFDIWANHLDRRQRIYLPDPGYKTVRAVFLDNGRLFGGGQWNFSDGTEQARFRTLDAANVDWKKACFSTWFERFRKTIPRSLTQALKLVPLEWCPGSLADLEKTLLLRLCALESIVEPFTVEFEDESLSRDPNGVALQLNHRNHKWGLVRKRTTEYAKAGLRRGSTGRG